MKRRNLLKTLAISVLCLSFSSVILAQDLDNAGVSQSYYITETGRPVSVKSEVPSDLTKWSKLYSPDGFFYQKELVTYFGSKYILMNEAGAVHTIDSRGDFYKGITQYIEGKLKVTGANYFITSKDIMYIVKTNGELVKRERTKEDIKFNKLSHAGGMFIISKDGEEIGIINPFTGDIDYRSFKRLAPIQHEGDNFIITIDNKLYAAGFTKKATDIYESTFNEQSLPEVVRSVKLTGGNFFVDQDNTIHTINDEGLLSIEGTVINGYSDQAPVAIGGNYFFYSDGSMYMVDEDGMVNYIDKIKDSLLITNKK